MRCGSAGGFGGCWGGRGWPKALIPPVHLSGGWRDRSHRFRYGRYFRNASAGRRAGGGNTDSDATDHYDDSGQDICQEVSFPLVAHVKIVLRRYDIGSEHDHIFLIWGTQNVLAANAAGRFANARGA